MRSRKPIQRESLGVPYLMGGLLYATMTRSAAAQSDANPVNGNVPSEETGESFLIGVPNMDALFGLRLLDLGLGQWIALLALTGVAYALSFLIVRPIFRVLLSLAKRSTTPWDEALFNRVVAPTRLATAVAIFHIGALTLQLPEQGIATISAVSKVLIVASMAWMMIRVVDLFSVHIERGLNARRDAATVTLVPLGRRVTKVFICTLAALSVLQNLGFSIGGLLAGLGIGGLAIAFAAQKTLENLFGGFVLVADRPIRIGDFCRAGEHLGTIEDIGMRSSKIRTLDRTIVSVPNAELSTVRIENYGVRDKMRIYLMLQVGYDTSPDQMRYLLVELRRMLYAHPKTLTDPCRVRFANFGAHSLDIEVFVFIDTQDWNEFTGIREDIYLRILEIVENSGTYFAYPSQTLYLGRDSGRDTERSAAAEAVVEQWRRTGTLPLPEFSETMIAEVDDTLSFPETGAVKPEAVSSL